MKERSGLLPLKPPASPAKLRCSDTLTLNLPQHDNFAQNSKTLSIHTSCHSAGKKSSCKPVEREENYEKGPRGSRAGSQMGNPNPYENQAAGKFRFQAGASNLYGLKSREARTHALPRVRFERRFVDDSAVATLAGAGKKLKEPAARAHVNF
jgi:hypothetical protein